MPEILDIKELLKDWQVTKEEMRTETGDLPGLKFDKDKDDWSLLPLEAVETVVKILTFGAKKYERDNWRKVKDWRNRYYSAIMRHFAAWRKGERLDPESGMSHLSHIGCNVMFLIALELDELKEKK